MPGPSSLLKKPQYQEIFEKGFPEAAEDFSVEGLNPEGYKREGFSVEGLNPEGYKREGLNPEGVSGGGFTAGGYSAEGFSAGGFSAEGFDGGVFPRVEYDRGAGGGPAREQESVEVYLSGFFRREQEIARMLSRLLWILCSVRRFRRRRKTRS